MSTFAWAATASALLLGLGAVALTRRRGAMGLLVASQLFAGSLISLAVTLFSLTGRSGALGQVVITAIMVGAVGSATILLAVRVAEARAAGGRSEGGT